MYIIVNDYIVSRAKTLLTKMDIGILLQYILYTRYFKYDYNHLTTDEK